MTGSVGEYKTVEDVISDLNVMVVEAPIPDDIKRLLAVAAAAIEIRSGD